MTEQQISLELMASEPDFTVEQLGGISVPVLLLDGERDEAIYTEHTIEMAGLIPTAKLTLIPGTGHFGFWEKPAEMHKATQRSANPTICVRLAQTGPRHVFGHQSQRVGDGQTPCIDEEHD